MTESCDIFKIQQDIILYKIYTRYIFMLAEDYNNKGKERKRERCFASESAFVKLFLWRDNTSVNMKRSWVVKKSGYVYTCDRREQNRNYIHI